MNKHQLNAVIVASALGMIYDDAKRLTPDCLITIEGLIEKSVAVVNTIPDSEDVNYPNMWELLEHCKDLLEGN